MRLQVIQIGARPSLYMVFLQAFSDATKAFSVDRHPTAHLFLKLVLAIRDVLLDERWLKDMLLHEMANTMYVKFQKYWDEPNIVLKIAAVMDPTQKLDYLKFYFHTIGLNVGEKITELRRFLDKYYLEYEKVVRSRELPTFTERDKHNLANEPSSSSLGGTLLGKRRIELAFAQFTSQNIDVQAKKSELDIYLEEPRLHSNSEENFDVLGWWERNSDVYPVLSLMARDFLAIPVTTVSSESAFSAAGRILGKYRTSLSPETLEAVICTKDWIIGFDDDEKGYATEGTRICDLEDDL
uniref:HAT C-terminal dimerisation domain-containing protein n=1 Tax=Oryza brachyantha TaxID=4533 RepID=J3LF36_ORYBR